LEGDESALLVPGLLSDEEDEAVPFPLEVPVPGAFLA
jgi:hypothetical protein